MQQQQSNTSAGGKGGSGTFFRRKKAIPLAVAKKIGSNKPPKTTPSADATPSLDHNVSTGIDTTLTGAQRTVQGSIAMGASIPTEEIIQSSKVEQAKREPSKKPAAFRRVRPKISILSTSKDCKSTVKAPTAQDKLSTPTKPDSPATPYESVLNDSPGVENEQTEAFVSPNEDQIREQSTQTVAVVLEQDEANISEEENVSENNASLRGAQTFAYSDQRGNEKQRASSSHEQRETLPDIPNTLSDEQDLQRSSFPNLQNDKENVLFAPTAPTAMPKSTAMEENSPADSSGLKNHPMGERKKIILEGTDSLPGAATSPVVPTKTIKRTIKLANLPLDLTKQLKSAMGIGQRANTKLTADMLGAKKSQQSVQRSDDVKAMPVNSSAAAVLKLGEIDLSQNNTSQQLPDVDSRASQSHRFSEEVPTEPTIVSLSTADDSRQTPVAMTSLPVPTNDNSFSVASDPLETSGRPIEPLVDSTSGSMKSLPLGSEDSMQLVESHNSGNVSSVTATDAVSSPQHPSSGSKKIKKISYLTPLQQKMVLSSLTKGKPKCPDAKEHQLTPTHGGVNTEMDNSAGKQLPGISALAISTSAPKTPTVNFTSPERKIQIISHVILPNLKIPSSCNEGTTAGDPSQFAVDADQSSPNRAIHPASPSTSSFAPTGQPPSSAIVYDQYPKLFVIHSTGAIPSDILSVPSRTSTATTGPSNEIIRAALPEATGGVLQSNSQTTAEKRPESHGLVLTVLPRQLPPETSGVVLSAIQGASLPSSDTFSASRPPNHRIVPKIVIDKSFVENDSQSSSSCSSSSSPEQTSNVSQLSPRKAKAKLKENRNEPERLTVDSANTTTTATETQSKIMGCSPNTRDKLRERVLKNLESHKPPVELFPAARHVYSRKSQRAPVPFENAEMELKSLTSAVEMESNRPGIALPMDLRMQSTQLTTSKMSSADTDDDDHNFTPTSTLNARQQSEGRETLDFYGFSNASIDSEQLESGKKIRAIELMLQAERIKLQEMNPDGSIYREHESDRSNSAVMVYNVSDAMGDYPDDQDDHNEPLEGSIDLANAYRKSEIESKSPTLEPVLPTDEVIRSSSNMFKDQHDSPCETCTYPVALQDPPDVSVKNILPSEVRIHDSTTNYIEETGGNTQSMERGASDKDESDLALAETVFLEKVAKRSLQVVVEGANDEDKFPLTGGLRKSIEKDDLEILDQCSVADRRHAADDTLEEDKCTERTNLDAQASTSTIAPLRAPLNTRSSAVSDVHETTGVDLIVAMAMSMKETEAEDDEHSEVDSEAEFETSRFEEKDQEKESVSCAGNVREQSVGNLSKISKKKRKKKRDKIVELLLRHVNYESLMGELLTKGHPKQDSIERALSNTEDSDEDESESIAQLMRYAKAKAKSTLSEMKQSTCARNLSTDDTQDVKMLAIDEEANEEFASECIDAAGSPSSGAVYDQVKLHQTQADEAYERIVDNAIEICSEIKTQEVEPVVYVQSGVDGDEFNSSLKELPLKEIKKKSEALLRIQEQRQRDIEPTRAEPQHVRKESTEQCREPCKSFANICYDNSTVHDQCGDPQNRDIDDLSAYNKATCDMTTNEEITRPEYCPTRLQHAVSVEVIDAIRSSLCEEDSTSCLRTFSEATDRTAVVTSDVTTTICDISNNAIIESTTVLSTTPDGVQDCVKIDAAEAERTAESSTKSSVPGPVSVGTLEESANVVETTDPIKLIQPATGNKKGVKKGRKRSNKFRPAKRKKQLNLLDIKPSSPPVFDSSEPPVANEVVSDCSTDGFSVVDRNGRQKDSVQNVTTTPMSMDVEGQSGTTELENVCRLQSISKPNNAEECSSTLTREKPNIKRTKGKKKKGADKYPGGGVGDDDNVESNGEDSGKGNLAVRTETTAPKSSSGSKSQAKNKEIVVRGNARRSRSRKSRRSFSSSSSRRSSSGDSNKEAVDMSSDDSLRPRFTRAAKRRKMKRKKRRTPRGRSTDTVSALSTTTTTNASVITTRVTNSSTRRSARCKPSKASKISKASNTDERYVISEIDTGDETGSAPERVLEVVNVRYQQVLDMASSRSTRSSFISAVPLARLTTRTAENSTINCSREKLASGAGSGRSEPESADATEQTSDDTTMPLFDPSKQPKRGRPPKQYRMKPVESDESEDDGVAVYKCGNCEKDIHRSAWKEHYAYHNGLAFRVGIDEPIDRNDIHAVGHAIMRFMRANRQFEVICEKCGEIKKSFMGMASHLRVCGIPDEEKDSAKVACEHCGRKMLIVSLATHLALYCRVLKKKFEKEAVERGGTGPMDSIRAGASEDAEVQLTASGRQKRRSVACAEKKIRKLARETIEEPEELIIKVTGQMVSKGILQSWLSQLKDSGKANCLHKGCFFVGISEKSMREHNDICPFGQSAVPVYECAICLCQDPSREVVYEHMRREHPEELNRTRLSSVPSADDSDNFVVANEMVDGSSDSEDVDHDAVVSDDLMADGRKGGRKRNQSQAQSRAKRGERKARKATGSKSGSIAPEEELQHEMGVMGEEGEVYKEMVYEEAAEYRKLRTHIQFTTIEWTFKFLREHYGTRQLFEQLRPDVDVRFLTMLAIRDYLPQSNQSIRFQLRKVKRYDAPYHQDALSNGWQQLGTFQGEVHENESMFYCGGPVMAIDWLPIPNDAEGSSLDQILAVACKSRYGEFYTCQQLSKPLPCKCLIQIWNVGPLKNTSEYDNVCPQLSFAIACDFGPIWQLAFCPSGCNNETIRGDSFDRLGLLAATGSDGDVYVFALNRSMVSFRSEVSNAKSTPRIVHLQPVLRLTLTLHQRHPSCNEPNVIPCFTGHSVMRISWTREKGHTVLAAGYSNGAVAVWKLTPASFSSPLLSASKDGIRTLLPTHKLLHACGGSITALDIHYGQGSRFLAVTNADRRVKVYDLHSGHHQPLEVFSLQARSRITAIRWLLHFPVLVFVFDDTFMVDRCAYSVLQPREIGIRTIPLVVLGTEATDLAANEWISTNAITTDGGDLVSHKPIPFVAGIPGRQFEQVLTTTISVRLNNASDSPTNVSSYDAFCENFGLLFSDTDADSAESDRKTLGVKTFRRGNIDQYPAVRLNQVRWNPNNSSFLYYAVGYQAGFVRIRKVQV